MARYYHETRPEHNDLFMNSKLGRQRTKTGMLLRTEFWQGQQNFDETSEVHARHMRPLCDSISIDPIANEPAPKNTVLFMPYLHWETDRGRENSAEIIKDAEAMKDKISTIAEAVNEAQHRVSKSQDEHQNMSSQLQPLRPITTTATQSPQRRKYLGEVLKQAARLLEAMEFYAEEQLVKEYLHHESPFHPRRTLDQSYYGALKDTGSRDRDQVVYRATTPEAHECIDHLDEVTGKCRRCSEEIRMVPRLIMVDQLWLWILDESTLSRSTHIRAQMQQRCSGLCSLTLRLLGTVVTAFPRRFGKNKPDPSAIHKSLRLRLQFVRAGEINNVYDLALIIIDECSRVFFDRTRINKRVPNLIDTFADAIRSTTMLQTAAYSQFLIYTHLASRQFNRDLGDTDLSTQNTLLNINPEGNLLKEVKDIMDEIHMISRIKKQQQTVVESFVKHIRSTVIAPITRSSSGTRSGVIRRSGTFPTLTSSCVNLVGEDVDAGKVSNDRTQWTLARAEQLLLDIQDRIFELETLSENASITSNHVSCI